MLSKLNITIIDEDFVLVTYDPSLKVLFIIWRGIVYSEQYKRVFITSLDFARKYPMQGFLSDISQQKLKNHDDLKWFEKEILPLASELGFSKGAVVYDGNIFKEYYLNRMVNKVKKYSIPFKFFKSRKNAFEWLIGESLE